MHTMTSLVAYDDSDQEDNSRIQGQPAQHYQGFPSAPSTMSPISQLGGLSGVVTQMRHTPNSAPKRPPPAPSGIRPYIPKRQRGAQQHDGIPTQTAPPAALSNTLSLSEGSDIVRPYLGQKSRVSRVPGHVRVRVQAHQGPINTVQWCPVSHLSHLLLSASMDRTAKIWDGVGSARCLFTSSSHRGAVRDACWTSCGKRLLTGSFDEEVHLTDVETGQLVVRMETKSKVSCLAVRPGDPNTFLCGGFSNEVQGWDMRSSQAVRQYQTAIQQTLDILFLRDGAEFVSSSDVVSRDSADRTLIAWDFQTTAKISNQIFHERYTCPSMALHPYEDFFVAQTNGNYMALFAAQRPYRINKRKRYEGHLVEGYSVGCEYSPDGTMLTTGSADGSIHFYDALSSRRLRTLKAHAQACLCATLHPVLPGVAASCDWAGEVCVWH